MKVESINRGTLYLTPQQLTDRWQGVIKIKTLTYWRSMKMGPSFVKIGGKPLYPIDAIVEYERAGKMN